MKQKKNKINTKLAEGNNKDESVDKQNKEQKKKRKPMNLRVIHMTVTYKYMMVCNEI